MLASLDLFRSKLLKVSFKFTFMRNLFLSRPNRVAALFFAAASFYLLISSFFPLWVLLMGPILWGIPHLISSLRYTSLSFSEKSRNQLMRFQFFIWSFIFIYRLSVDFWKLKLFLYEHPLLMETICLIISFIYQLHIYRRISFKMIASSLGFAILIAATYFYPIQTALFALIGHNYLPLMAWYKSCQDRSDLNAFFISGAIYILFSLMIYFGIMDSLYAHYSPSGNIAFLNWDYSEVISPFVTGDFDYRFWFHIVVLYAFSQAMHYFIWMKAIPENYQARQHPPSFQWSYNKLVSDFGSTSIFLLLTLTGLGFLMWFFVEFQTARLVYFAIASYHGFMEISAIPFLKSNRKDF